MLKYASLGIAGAVGTIARYWLSGLVQRHCRESFPYGTLAVNVAGCFLIGLLAYLIRERQMLGPETRTVLMVGLLGGFTTFSAFGYETIELLRGGSYESAVLNVLGNVLAGLAAVWLGMAVPKALGLSREEGSDTGGEGGPMKIEGEARLLRIFIGESDRLDGKPLYEAIVERARDAGVAGATVLRGLEGFGASSRIHTARILRLSEDLPLVIEIVDREERIRELIPILDGMIRQGLMTLEKVEVIAYRPDPGSPD